MSRYLLLLVDDAGRMLTDKVFSADDDHAAMTVMAAVIAFSDQVQGGEVWCRGRRLACYGTPRAEMVAPWEMAERTPMTVH